MLRSATSSNGQPNHHRIDLAAQAIDNLFAATQQISGTGGDAAAHTKRFARA